MIDQIHFSTSQRRDGAEYDTARVWIGGIPFSADLMPGVEATTRRIAAEMNIQILDTRSAAPSAIHLD